MRKSSESSKSSESPKKTKDRDVNNLLHQGDSFFLD